MILFNEIACKNCGDIIRSEHRHDYVSCSCGQTHVDGGTSYLKRSFGDLGYWELSMSLEWLKTIGADPIFINWCKNNLK